MSPKIDHNINVLTFAAEEPITDFEIIMAKINHEGNRNYNGIENIAMQNEDISKKNTDEVQP